MGRVKSFRFDPGSLESVELRMWMVPRTRRSDAGPQIKAHASGTYRVYCGSGWEHSADIDERHVFDLDRPSDQVDERLASAWSRGDTDAAWDATHQLVEWALEDWTDPCAEDADEWLT
jgi:hypothetical protein